MILIISLDLKGPSGSYKPLFDSLRKQGVWWHYMKSTWLIDTEKSPQQIVDEIKPYLQPPDLALISQFSSPYQGLLPKDAWQWIKKHNVPTLFSKTG